MITHNPPYILSQLAGQNDGDEWQALLLRSKLILPCDGTSFLVRRLLVGKDPGSFTRRFGLSNMA